MLALGAAFTGYVLVAGNMSFWAAIVILNLITVIPILANTVISSILGDVILTSFGIKRFAVLHFVLGIAVMIFSIIHIIFLHRSAPSNNGHLVLDGYNQIAVILVKDLFLILAVLYLFLLESFWALIHPDNWNNFDMVTTPSHIEPEIYFLWTFAIIKNHNSKLAGLVIGLVTDYCL